MFGLGVKKQSDRKYKGTNLLEYPYFMTFFFGLYKYFNEEKMCCWKQKKRKNNGVWGGGGQMGNFHTTLLLLILSPILWG